MEFLEDENQISLAAAKGIEYIHNYAIPPNIRRDSKPSTILSDSNWNTKISNFGLSLHWHEIEQELVTTRKIAKPLNEVHQTRSAMLPW